MLSTLQPLPVSPTNSSPAGGPAKPNSKNKDGAVSPTEGARKSDAPPRDQQQAGRLGVVNLPTPDVAAALAENRYVIGVCEHFGSSIPREVDSALARSACPVLKPTPEHEVEATVDNPD